jgi:hypothetical protein
LAGDANVNQVRRGRAAGAEVVFTACIVRASAAGRVAGCH